MNSMSDEATPVAVSVNKVSKNFKLPHEKTSSIKSGFANLLRPKNKTVEIQHALRDISFEIKEGEFFGIVGRNGSGKSTLLKILASIYVPTNGSVQVKGRLVPFIELGVGFNPELTGRENVFLNGALLGFSKREVEARYEKIVEFAELKAFMDQKLKNYSSGMQVRLAFAVAIIAEADVLLIDEVLAVGDADFQRKCFQYFKMLKKNKKTVIFVTHDMNAVNEYCDRAMLIDNSRKIVEGRASDIADAYLKLFNKNQETQAVASEDRWGNGQVTFKKVTARVTDDMLIITMKLTAAQDTSELVAGFRIKASSGEVVTGINTQQKMAKTFALKAHESIDLSWELPNVFGSDTFAVDATVRLSDKVTIYDNWDGAANFTVKRKDKTPYLVEPPVTLTMEGKVYDA
jgi:ABC-2 type transport system ATP-binding protein